MAEWLAAWSHVELVPVATVVANVFVENVLQHTACTPVLALVASVCRAWGSTPMSSGKTVWAVLGPENQL